MTTPEQEAAEAYGVAQTVICPGEHHALIKPLQQTTASHFLAGITYRDQNPSDAVKGLVEALEKIADPRKRDHKEPDTYTTLGCVMHIADEALTKYREQAGALSEAKETE